MKLPLSWLKDFVDVDFEPKELAEKLLGVGFEVEEIIYTGKDIENVVVGQILSIEKHPSADKLQVCNVNVGDKELVIVTSATNISAGDKVPVALDGSLLPTGNRINTGQLRGVTSYGMFCSGEELKIDDSVCEGASVYGILILPCDSVVGEDIKTTLGLNEYVFDVSIPANRPDCQSVFGIAREVAALYGVSVKKPNLSYVEHYTDEDIFSVDVKDKNICPLYTGRLIRNVRIAPSPKWMQRRLSLVGIRAINNIVDITNYVLTEIGQPLHAFDVSLLSGGIVVRHAEEGESIVALDGNAYKLFSNMLVIADIEKPVAIAGVMGGEYSGINNETTCVFLEAARFAKESIRTTSRALGLRSDSSARYEKGVDYNSVDLGRERALALFDELGAGEVTQRKVSDGVVRPDLKVIETSATQINDLFGIVVDKTKMVDILSLLGFLVSGEDDKIVCTVPEFREDVDNYTDLAEEIIRYYGYDALTSEFIKDAHPTVGGKSVKQKNIDAIKNAMASIGAYECYTYSFINENQFDKLSYAQTAGERNVVRLINPLSEEFSVMRTQLVGSMLDVVALNLNRKNADFRLFEISNVYIPRALPISELPDERSTLCVAFVGKDEDFYSLKSSLASVLGAYVSYDIKRSDAPYLHPGIGADILLSGKVIGSFGKIHPVVAKAYGVNDDVYIAQIDLEDIVSTRVAPTQFRSIPKFPIVDRDLAVIVSEDVTVGSLVAEIKSSIGELCESVELFDIYRGEQIEKGQKSVAFSIKLRSDEKTLVDAEISDCINAAIDGLQTKFGARLR